MRKISRFKFIFLLLGVLSSGCPWTLHASPPPQVSVQAISRKIGHSHFGWSKIKADFNLQIEGEQSKAFCQGHILYDRLNEKMLLTCFNRKSQMLFAIKTEDKNFEFYLPAEKILYQGNIFELRNNTRMEKYLSPLNLYRALKPMFFDWGQTQITAWDGQTAILNISLPRGLNRRIVVSKTGLVIEEVYSDKRQKLTIQRGQFEKIATFNPEKGFYPHLIRLVTSDIRSKNLHAATFQFKHLEFSPDFSQARWDLDIGEGTRVISIRNDEENYVEISAQSVHSAESSKK